MATSPALKVRFPSLQNHACAVTQAQLPMHNVTLSACCRCCLLYLVPNRVRIPSETGMATTCIFGMHTRTGICTAPFALEHSALYFAHAACFSPALLHHVLPDFRLWQALSHGPAGDAAVGGVPLSPSTMAVAQGPSLAAASGTTVPGNSQPHILIVRQEIETCLTWI